MYSIAVMLVEQENKQKVINNWKENDDDGDDYWRIMMTLAMMKLVMARIALKSVVKQMKNIKIGDVVSCNKDDDDDDNNKD